MSVTTFTNGHARTGVFAIVLASLAACSGGEWATEESGTTESLDFVWGSGATNIWAVGRSGTIVHSDGDVWARETSPTSARLTRIAGSSASDVWAVGDNGTVLLYDGTSWSSVESPTTDPLEDVWSFGPDDVWVVSILNVYRWNGSTWTDLNIDGEFEYVWASGPNDVWLIQSLGEFAHWDGAS